MRHLESLCDGTRPCAACCAPDRQMGCEPGLAEGAMRDAGYGLRRIILPRTSVNKGKKKGRNVITRPFAFESSA
jgi:hypothetical protein